MPFADYKTALVTGASSGIGAAVVERLCQEGVEVHALARSADKLAELAAKTGCIAHAIDVTDLAGLTALFARQRFDIVVNNAGVGITGPVEVQDMEIRRPDLEDVFLQVMSGTSASNIPLEGVAL